MTGAIPLGLDDLLISAALVLVAGLVSLILRLRLERQLAIASLRTVIQLLLIGYVLRFVFGIDRIWLILGLLLVMTAIASSSAVQRAGRTFRGAHATAFLTLVLSGFLTTFTVTGLIIGVDPWYRPQYVIPLMGMILGNGLTGISLCLDHLLESLSERRAEVEMELAHGATRWEAASAPLAAAVRRGMIPIINSMMVVGIVALPGMMTGQILEGADPLNAVKYQIMVMFMIAAATSLGCILMSILVYLRLFNTHHQLRAELIRKTA
jgi:putative ABC transport system permease protein